MTNANARVKIKICGMTRMRDIEAANRLRPDYIGFVFAPSRRRIAVETARLLRAALDPAIRAVGVFVNSPLSQVRALCREHVIDTVQLHGDEDAGYIVALKDQTGVPVIRAVRVESAAQVLECQAAPCDYLLLDSGRGGTGIAFDWDRIPALEKPWFLAGGLHAGNIGEALRRLAPYGADVSSGAETDGLKDVEKMKRIIEIVRSEG